MVHALQEVWRVLASDGRLLDSREIASHSRVEVVAGEQVMVAGATDDSVYIPDDVACDQALAQILAEGWFEFERRVFFDTAWHYDSLATLKEQFEADRIIISESVLAQAQELLTRGGADAQVRYITKTLVARYRKLPRQANHSGV